MKGSLSIMKKELQIHYILHKTLLVQVNKNNLFTEKLQYKGKKILHTIIYSLDMFL